MTPWPGLTPDGRLVDRGALHRFGVDRVLAALEGRGESARVVGGAVRDLALGRPASDFDVATTAVPEVVVRRAAEAGFGVALTGVSHGTVTIIVGGRPFEVTTLRRDIETDGRHAKVIFGRDFEADALRRDFTINALSVDVDGKIHDPVGGLADLAAGRVRFIGDAQARVREDYLRILRFYRFSAHFATGEIDAEGERACLRERTGLERLSRERIRAELFKMLVAPRPAIVFAFCEAGLLAPLIAGADARARFLNFCGLEAARGRAPDAVLRLAALALFSSDDCLRLRERLRLSNAEMMRLARASELFDRDHDRRTPADRAELQRRLFENGREANVDALMLTQVEAGAALDDPEFLGASLFLDGAPVPQLPVKGADVIKLGVPAGPGVRATLKSFQAIWIRAGFPKSPDQLAALLDAAVIDAARPDDSAS